MSKIAMCGAVRSFLLLFVFIATCVGVSGRYFEHRDNNKYYTTAWKFSDQYGRTYDTNDLECTEVAARLRGSAGLAIPAIIFHFAALCASLADNVLGNNVMITHAITGLHIFSLILLTVSWALGLSVFLQGFCGGFGKDFVPRENGMQMAYGLALLITAWSVQFFLVSVFHFATVPSAAPAPQEPVAVANEPYAQKSVEEQPAVQYAEAPVEQQEQAPAAEEQHYEQAPAEEQQQNAQEQQQEMAPVEQQ